MHCCYGYSIYDPHITYPFHYYKNLWYRESLSLYLLLNISFTNHILPFKNPKTPFLFTLLYLLHFCYIRVKGQHSWTCRVEHSNLYSNTFLKWQMHLRHFRHLKTVLNHYINFSLSSTNCYIPINWNIVVMILTDTLPVYL